MKYNVLFFPWRDWNSMKREGFRTREANILLAMRNNPQINKILCVNRSKLPSYLKLVLNMKNGGTYSSNSEVKDEFYDSEKVISKRMFSNLKKIDDKLFILDVDYHLPNPKGNKLERLKIFNRILRDEVDFSLKEIEMEKYLTWCFDLTRMEVANTFKEDILIFDSIDNLLEHDQNKKDSTFLRKMYGLAEDNSELIFTVSKELKSTFFSKHKNAFYIPNAINLKTYKLLDENSHRPSDLPQGPIVGYVGLMQERLDVKILNQSLSENPNVQFVFLGPVFNKNYFKTTMQYKNAHFIGPKHHSQIPLYLKHFDICIIPHKVNNFTKSMNPLKLYEYLAAGKEVITTSVPPSEDYKDVVHITDNSSLFSNKIANIIKQPFKDFSQEDVLNSIKKEDWEFRLKEMLDHINRVNVR
ncbi:glycosyltransferase [Niallia taxi]|uniref:glycosyltransferase n=1 Tax=Niallia taxi TaxID=2499688 RepID=UPI003982294B